MSMNRFRCTLFSHPQDRQTGDYLHRVVWPGKALGRFIAVHAIQSCHPDHLQELVDSDVLVIQMVADARLLAVIQKRRQQGKVTVFEISDDFTAFPAHLPGHAFYASREVQETIATLAAASNAVQFSSPFLEQKYRDLNPAHAVFPNQLISIPALKPVKKRQPVLGWAGSIGHFDDARRIAGVLSRWPLKHQVRLHIMAAAEIIQLFRAVGLDVQASPTGDMSAYLDFLKTIDIGLAVATIDDFSSGRSDGKFLEYASRGVVAVCSDGSPYADSIVHGETGFLFKDDEDMLDILTRLIESAELRKRIRRQAHQYIRANRTHARAAADRLSFYTQLMNLQGSLAATDSATESAGYREIIADIEPAFVQAMLMHRAGRAPEAIRIYTRLVEKTPDFYLLWERMSQACTAIGAGEQAASCNARASALLAQEYARLGLIADAGVGDPQPARQY
ncbi:MAG: glycosyltransferase [Gammaproteobacteria bacterium]